MKCFGLSVTISAATLFHATALSAAPGEMAAQAAAVSPEDLAAVPAPATTGGRMEELLRRFDTNRDGRIDEAERAAAREAMVKEGVDRQMMRGAAAPASPEELRQRMLTLFDGNGDGRLDESERADARQFAEELATGTGSERTASLREAMLKRYDRNGNGRIDAEEREQAREVFAAGRGRLPIASSAAGTALESIVRTALQQHAEQRERFDTNRDGELDDTEWAAARIELARVLAGGDSPERRERLAAELERRRQLRENAAERAQAPK